MNKKIFAFAILLAGLLISLSIIQAKAAANDSSISFKKDPTSGLFTMTVKDPDGIQEFSMTPANKFPYGGGLSGCPKTFSINNVSFADPVDFEPTMPAYVIDCRNNTANLEIAPPKDGVTKSVSTVKEENPPAPQPVPTEKPKEKKAGAPLSASDVIYPVNELGGCQTESECRSYCDNAQHAKECFAFATKYNLITKKEAQEERDKFLSVTNGPGGCNSGASCETYCNNVNHLDECIAFAEKNDYYTGDQLAEAKKFQALVKSGKKFPGDCKDRNACELYCNDANHMEECLNFAEDTGFMPEEEIAQARKILPLMKRGETPGGCTSKEQCEKYCFEDNHTEECIAFGERAGLISSEDAALIKKTGGKGPGGCRSKEQCDSYCETNGDECFRWAQDNGLIDDADLEKMKKGISQFKEQLDKVPPEVVECLKDAAGEKNFNKLINGQPVFDRGLESKMKSCFSQVTSQLSNQLNTLPPEASECIQDAIGEEGLQKLQSGEFDQDVDFSDLEECFQKLQSSFGGGPGGPGGPGGGFSGPGGCKSIDECTSYCRDNQDECQKFAPPGGGGPGGHGGFPGGPGGCKSPEECMNYCEEKEHQDECKSFTPPGGGATGGEFPGGSMGSGGQHDGFSECGITDGAIADYVCGINGTSRGVQTAPGTQTTYFNECHAKQQGAEIVHQGVCVRNGKPDKPCSDIAHPVCGTDGNSWTNECNAKEAGAEVKHEGICTMEDFGRKPIQSCAPLPSGLVSWSDDDTLSSASNGVILAPGKVGNALKFDGSGGHVSMANAGNLNFGTGPFSLETWFNWAGGEGVNNIFRKSNYPVSGPGAGYWLRIGGGGNLEFFTGETTGIDGQPRGTVSTPINANVWYHVAATRNSSGVMSLYLDGQLKGTAQAAGANTTSEAPLTLGAWDDRFGVTELFSGLIDEASVYDRALSSSEVQAIFRAGSAGKCTNPSSSGQNYGSQPPQQYPAPVNYPTPPSGGYTAPPTGTYSGPGGCKTPEECAAYCTAHYKDDPACSSGGGGSQQYP